MDAKQTLWRYHAGFGAHVIREQRTDGEFEGYIATTWGGENAANARLIAAAPELVRELQKGYARLADIRHDWPGRHTTEGQALLSSMRDAIAQALGVDPREVQDAHSTGSAS